MNNYTTFPSVNKYPYPEPLPREIYKTYAKHGELPPLSTETIMFYIEQIGRLRHVLNNVKLTDDQTHVFKIKNEIKKIENLILGNQFNIRGAQIEELESNYDNLQDSFSLQIDENDALKSKLKDLEEENLRLKQANEKNEKQYNNLKRKCDVQDEDISNLTWNLKRARNELEVQAQKNMEIRKDMSCEILDLCKEIEVKDANLELANQLNLLLTQKLTENTIALNIFQNCFINK